MAKNKNEFINLKNARLEEQSQVMEKIAEENHCPFCQENLKKYHKKPILKEGKYWLLTENQWPYDHTLIHYLFIFKKHAVQLQDLPPEAGKELFEMLTVLEKEKNIAGGALAMRFGDTDHSAGTINHLHAQFIIPAIEDEAFQPVYLKIGLQWEKRR